VRSKKWVEYKIEETFFWVRFRKESMKGFSVWMVRWAIFFDYLRKYFMRAWRRFTYRSLHIPSFSWNQNQKTDTFFLSPLKTNKNICFDFH
jgi:hypothetical protein